MPLVRRALKVLADREVSPQLGLLKSTLLQLDSTFTERDYGASTFRDFVQKLASAGHVALKGTDRSILVELRDGGEERGGTPAPPLAVSPAPAPAPSGPVSPPAEAAAAAGGGNGHPGPPPLEVEPSPTLWLEGVRAMEAAFNRATTAPRWPMYLRNLRQFLRAVDETFDERRYGFRGMIDAVRQGQREGLFRVERDRRVSSASSRVPACRARPRRAPRARRAPAEVPPTSAVDVPESEVLGLTLGEPDPEISPAFSSEPEVGVEPDVAPVVATDLESPPAPEEVVEAVDAVEVEPSEPDTDTEAPPAEPAKPRRRPAPRRPRKAPSASTAEAARAPRRRRTSSSKG